MRDFVYGASNFHFPILKMEKVPRNVSTYLPNYAISYPVRQYSNSVGTFLLRTFTALQISLAPPTAFVCEELNWISHNIIHVDVLTRSKVNREFKTEVNQDIPNTLTN
jgi:hypothetical protein